MTWCFRGALQMGKFSSCSFGSWGPSWSSMNASSLHKMTLNELVIHGGSHASKSLYAYGQGRPRTCRPALAEVFGSGRFRAQMQSRGGPARFVLRGLAVDVDLCRLPAVDRGALRLGLVQGAVGHLARVCRIAAAGEPRLVGQFAQGPASPTPAAGHRLDLDSLSWPTLPRSQGDLSQPGQMRHQPFPRLCVAVCRVPRPTLYGGPHPGREGRGHE